MPKLKGRGIDTIATIAKKDKKVRMKMQMHSITTKGLTVALHELPKMAQHFCGKNSGQEQLLSRK